MTDTHTAPAPARVVFACVHNAGRSQMSAALCVRSLVMERGWARA